MPPKKSGAALTLGLRSWVNRSKGTVDMVVPDKISVAAFRGERLQAIHRASSPRLLTSPPHFASP